MVLCFHVSSVHRSITCFAIASAASSSRPYLGALLRAMACSFSWPAQLSFSACTSSLMRADLLVEDQVLHRQQGIHRGGVGDGFDGDEAQLRAALVDVQPLSGAAPHQAGQVRRWK